MCETRVTFIVLLFVQFCYNLCNEKCLQDIEGTELLMTFLVHRHGDRIVMDSFAYPISTNPKEYIEMSEPYGLGELDEAGKARSFQLGKSFYRRYNQFFNTNLSNLYVRSTDYDRTIMTARIAITAAYSPELEWLEDMELMPFNYTVVPINYDYNTAFENCPRYRNFFGSVITTVPEVMRPYCNVTDILYSEIGLNQTITPLMLLVFSSVYSSQMSLGIPLSTRIESILSEITKGASSAFDIIFGNKDYITLQAGVLLKEFFKYADQVILGEVTPRMRVYSGHDFNVYSFVAVTGATPKQGLPDYCSNFALELRRVQSSGQYVVVPVYVSTPGEPEKYLKIEGCSGTLCDYEEFRTLTANRTINIDQYRERCQNDTLQYDITSITC